MTTRERKRSSQRTEAGVARDHGGQRTPRSGAGFIKGDGRVPGRFRIENKETSKQSYRFTLKEWLELVTEARKCGEIPVFHIVLTGANGRRYELAVTRYLDHKEFVRAFNEECDAADG